MYKEQITDKEAFCLIALFIMGSTLILGAGGEAKNDSWLAAIVGLIFAIPMLFIYSRLLFLFPEKDLFDILNIIFGNFFGKIISILYIWYAFHLGALVLRNFGEFMNTVTMPETPMLVSLFCMGMICVIAVNLGIEVISRFSAYVFPILIFILVFIDLLGITNIHFSNIKPFLGNGITPVLKGGFLSFSFPFAESVLFLGVFFSLKTKKSPLKIYLSGVIFAGVICISLTARNILVLGEFREKLYFPSYAAVSRINIGDFLQRMEGSVALVLLLGVFIKTSICLFVACKGISKLFNLNHYSSITIQVGLLMIYFSRTVFDSTMEMQNWAFKVYRYYAFPFQVIIPIFIWIFAEVKIALGKNKSKGAASK